MKRKRLGDEMRKQTLGNEKKRKWKEKEMGEWGRGTKKIIYQNEWKKWGEKIMVRERRNTERKGKKEGSRRKRGSF